MDPQRWRALKELFHDAVVLDGEALAAFLDEVEARDPVLHGDLVALVAADGEADHILDADPASLLGGAGCSRRP